jgi:hypothetical protein
MSATSRVLYHVRASRIQERLGETSKMHYNLFGNFIYADLEIVKLHHAIRAEIAVANLVLRTVDTRDLAADHRRDFQMLHFQRSLHKKKGVETTSASWFGLKWSFGLVQAFIS